MVQFLALLHGGSDRSSDVSGADACSQQNTDTSKSTDGSVVMVSSFSPDARLCGDSGYSGDKFDMNIGHDHSGESFCHYHYFAASSSFSAA